MSNTQAVRTILAAMWHLACMIVFIQAGDNDAAQRSEDKFKEIFRAVDAMAEGEGGDGLAIPREDTEPPR